MKITIFGETESGLRGRLLAQAGLPLEEPELEATSIREVIDDKDTDEEQPADSPPSPRALVELEVVRAIERGEAHGQNVLDQLVRCAEAGDAPFAVLCGDGHLGYSQPIGGVVAYENYISPSGVGYDISCGNKAVRTPLLANDVDIARVMDEIKIRISFGIGRFKGRGEDENIDHPVLGEIAHASFAPQQTLLRMATDQLGTVGSGNHYVDLLEDQEGYLWVGVHFGSRGFGHRTASGFIALSQGEAFDAHAREGEMHAPPILFDTRQPIGQDYIEAMQLAGKYAYAGRDWVVDRVLKILGTHATFAVHAHHNFAWRERHEGLDVWVVRKGATPAFPEQYGFVGGSMGDISVVLKGKDSVESKDALYSTVHGAGRIMSRKKASGKNKWRRKKSGKGLINWDEVNRELKARGIVIRGGDADEAPAVYRKLQRVLDLHKNTVDIVHVLQPRGVAMAGYDTEDPYKD